MAWQQNWSPLNNFTMPAIPTQSQPYPNPMQFNPTMTPEQHFAMQQNWQQWQTYQQQYAQWQATYGEKYQQELQQKFSQNTSTMPPSMPQVGAMSSMPAMSHLPPPPPNQPAPLLPPPPENEAFQASANSKDPLSQRSFQASSTAASSGSINRKSHFPTQPPMNHQFNRGIGAGINHSQNQFSGHIARNKFESVVPANPPPQTNEFVAKPLNPIAEDVADKTPEEKAFDEQFQKWEEEFASWKQQNANHPDTRAYKEYEQKMEECRTKLLERREQMQRRKMELLLQQQQLQQQKQQPVKATANALEQSRVSNEQKFGGYNHSSGSLEKNDSIDKVGGGDVQPLLESPSHNKSHMFMRSSASGSGIPGLDLVVDKPTDDDADGGDVNDYTVVINDISPKREGKPTHPKATIQQRPDLEAISRGITSILGDPNLASLLSNFQPKSIPVAKSAIPSLLDMKMPDIDLDNVPRFSWRDDDDDDDDDDEAGREQLEQNSVQTIHQRQTNDSAANVQPNENDLPNCNQLNGDCDGDEYDDDFDADQEHERFAEMNYDDDDNNDNNDNDDRPFHKHREESDNFPNATMNRRENFNRNMLQHPHPPQGNNSIGSSNFMDDNEPNDNFNKNRSNFMNDSGNSRLNFASDNFNQNRSNFNENMRGSGNSNSFAGGRNAGHFNQQNSMNFHGNRMNPFDNQPAFGHNSNFANERNQVGNNFQQCGDNNFGNNFSRSMGNKQFNGENGEFNARNDDRPNMNMNNDFCRRRNINSNDGNFNDFDASNSQFSQNFRNNSRSDDNSHSQNNCQQFNGGAQNRGLPTDSFSSDNAKDEDFFRPTKVIDYSANRKKPIQIPATDEIMKRMKVVDYGHQTIGIVSRPQNASHHRPANKYTGGDFFPIKTIDYNHSSNKHTIKEYYYSIVSKWDPSSSSAGSKSMQSSQQGPNKSAAVDGTGSCSSSSEPIKQRTQPAAPNTKTRELKEITYEQLSAINSSTKQGKKMKRALIMKRSTVNDYPIGHKFYPSVKWQLLHEKSRKRPGLPTKRGKPPEECVVDTPNRRTTRTTDCENDQPAAVKPSLSVPIRPIRQNVVLLEDIIYNPGRQGRPRKIVIIMRGPPGSGKTTLAKLIKDKEADNDGVAVRILSIDDYFKTEVDEVRKCPETGKNLNVKKMIYEYEKDMEDTYMQYLMKSYKKTVVDGLFDFIIVDSIASTLRHYTEFYNFAKSYAFTPYTCEMEMDSNICFKRNIHQRTLDEIQGYCDHWSKTPEQYLKLDFDSFVRDARPAVDVDD